MNEWRNEVLKAEAAVRELANELARAKGIAESAEAVKRKLGEAATALEQSRKELAEACEAMQEITTQARTALDEAKGALHLATERLTQAAKDLPADVRRIVAEQGTTIQRLFKLLVACLVLTGATVIIGIVVIALIIVR